MTTTTTTTRAEAWIAALEVELDTFELDSHLYGQMAGDSFVAEVDGDGDVRVVMTVWCADNNPDDPADDRVKSFAVSMTADLGMGAREWIRFMLHQWICHEIDETIYFGQDRSRPFYPH